MTALPSPPSVVFLDRDGTVIVDRHFLADPDEVTLLPGVADAIARLNRARIPVILVTNQSGIGRGYFTVAQYEAVHQRLLDLLARHDARLDGAYMCPDPPEMPSECRKPKAGMFVRALREHAIPAGTPLLIGDRWRDIAAFAEVGGIGVLVPSPETTPDDLAQAQRQARVAPSLPEVIHNLFGGNNDS